MTRPTILVGQIWHEGHSFNPVLTTRDDFNFTRGDALLDEARGSATALSGIVKTAEELGYICVPALIARSRPGGAVVESVLDEIIEEFVDTARHGGFDAICLDLHGATLATETLDAEAELLARLRSVVGNEMPIAVALDLHAYMTPRMVKQASIVTSFRTTPHADIEETGARAMALLHEIITTGVKPRGVFSLVPLLTRGNDETSSGPLVEIHNCANRWRNDPAIVDVSIFNVHHFYDAPGYGQVVLAYDFGTGHAHKAAEQLSQMLWDARDEFEQNLPSVQEMLRTARSGDLKLVLGDQGDRVMGGGPGDSPEIGRIALEEFPDLKVAVPVYDPAAVELAGNAGIGATLDVGLGASVTTILQPLQRKWRVKNICRARFRNSGHYMRGTEADFGDAAVFECGNVTVIATNKAPNVHDPAFYEAVGVPFTSQDAVVARAANHYKLSFKGLARTVTVDTPGLTAFRPQDFPFNLSRPFYPLDQVFWEYQPIVVS